MRGNVAVRSNGSLHARYLFDNKGTTSLAASTSVTSISGSPAPHPARDRHPFDHAIELIG